MKYSKKFRVLAIIVLIFMLVAMLSTCGSIFDPYCYPEMKNKINFQNNDQVYGGGIFYEI